MQYMATATLLHLVAVMLIGSISHVSATCGDIHITSDTVGQFASYIHPSVTHGGQANRIIKVGRGTVADERLIEVPLGEIHPLATIQVTVGLNQTQLNTVDHDLVIGITDGVNENKQWTVDAINYVNLAPCYVVDGVQDSNFVAVDTKAPSTFKMFFTPFYKYGACETVQEGGYINTGTFNQQLDLTKPISVRISRNQVGETYTIYYVNVQIF